MNRCPFAVAIRIANCFERWTDSQKKSCDTVSRAVGFSGDENEAAIGPAWREGRRAEEKEKRVFQAGGCPDDGLSGAELPDGGRQVNR